MTQHKLALTWWWWWWWRWS